MSKKNYIYSGTEEFLSGAKVKYTKSKCSTFEISTPQPEKFAIVNLVTGNVGFLAMDNKGEGTRIIKKDGRTNAYRFQEVSLLHFCLDYIHSYAVAHGHDKREDAA